MTYARLQLALGWAPSGADLIPLISAFPLCLNYSDPGEAPDRRHGEAEADAPAESAHEAKDGERYVVKATPMDQLKKVADGDETGSESDPKADAAEAMEGADGNDTEKVEGDVDGDPRRFYHTVSRDT